MFWVPCVRDSSGYEPKAKYERIARPEPPQAARGTPKKKIAVEYLKLTFFVCLVDALVESRGVIAAEAGKA